MTVKEALVCKLAPLRFASLTLHIWAVAVGFAAYFDMCPDSTQVPSPANLWGYDQTCLFFFHKLNLVYHKLHRQTSKEQLNLWIGKNREWTKKIETIPLGNGNGPESMNYYLFFLIKPNFQVFRKPRKSFFNLKIYPGNFAHLLAWYLPKP